MFASWSTATFAIARFSSRKLASSRTCTALMGASTSAARALTEERQTAVGPTMTGFPSFIMPAFSAPIFSRVSPSILEWSEAIDVMMERSGVTIFCGIKPPQDPSPGQLRLCQIRKVEKAKRSGHFKKCGRYVIFFRCLEHSASKVYYFGFRDKLAIDLDPFAVARDVWGNKRPVRRPAASSARATFMQTEPFPFVPATCTRILPSL